MDKQFKKYIIFWLSQSVSQLGSAMTSFALILWVYTVKHSAFTLSMMSFCNYVPYIIVSLFAGTFVDTHSKKKIMLVSDSIAAVCTVSIFIMWSGGNLQIWHIYVVNAIIGFMNAFQSPASSVAIGKMVPKEKLANVSGMNSFSGNMISVFTPVIASFLFALSGLNAVLLIDMISFVFAFLVLLLVIKIPEDEVKPENKISAFAGCKEGYRFLLAHKAILMIVVTMALINFLSRLTYENILSPMVLSRSGDDSVALGIVNAVMGIGGILGGIIVSAGKMSKDNIKTIYFSAALSFLLGDLLMGAGRNVVFWSIAGLAASLPIPFINAAQNVILYGTVPEDMQGRIFAVRNAIQYSTIPAGILLGGFLADYVFEPYMQKENAFTSLLHGIVGEGSGSGMAVMFLCTGILGSTFCIICYLRLRKYREEMIL
ncbi:MAG: MFS transporter [Clostridiales bacterium]|nr:MFS transporter [Clostridiales bacterium]